MLELPVGMLLRGVLLLSLVLALLGVVYYLLGSDHVARWTAAGLREAERKFRRVSGYRGLEELERRLNPELHSQVQVA